MNSFNRKRPFQSIAEETGTSACGRVVEQRDDGEDNINVSVISELQKALHYLITRRENGDGAVRDEHSSSHDPDSTLHNKEPSESNVPHTNVNTNHQDSSDDDAALHAIPNMINRILLEHFPASKEREKPSSNTLSKSTVLTVDQKVLTTQLIIAIIIEFAEPHFVRVSKLRERSAAMSKKSRTEVSSESSRNDSSPNSISFSKRAVAWATSCLSCLLQTSLSSEESTHIPELDALLGATGEMDWMEMEEMIQHSILCGVAGSRMQHLGNVSGCVMGTKRTR